MLNGYVRACEQSTHFFLVNVHKVHMGSKILHGCCVVLNENSDNLVSEGTVAR